MVFEAITRHFRRPDTSAEFQRQFNANIVLNDRDENERQRAINEEINHEMIMDDRLVDVLEAMIRDAQTKKNENMACNLLSVRMRMSHVNRCSFLPSIAVTIAQLENELALKQMTIWADEESFEFGFANLMEACTQFTDIALHDAENGKKAHALKLVSMSKSYEVSSVNRKGEKA